MLRLGALSSWVQKICLGLARWLVERHDFRVVPLAEVNSAEAIKKLIDLGALRNVSAKERMWLEGLNFGTHVFVSVSDIEELERMAEPLVPLEHIEAAEDYVRFLDNCAIADSEKRRTATARMKEQFPKAKGHELSLAVELAVRSLRCSSSAV
jgi:hypothetical protein